MFLVVAKKSRTFFSFPYAAKEQVCRSWEGAQPGSQPKLASRNIPYHRCYAQYINGGWLGGRNFSISSVSSMTLTRSVKSVSSTKSVSCMSSTSSTIATWELAVQSVAGQ